MVRTERVSFQGSSGVLAARLDLPPLGVGGGVPRAYAVFAHCFTCSKDFPAASRISRALAERGYGVLRFDFTGLGGSDGDFANTNFSSNVEDLVLAAESLRERSGGRGPCLLVGHSLGGAAVLVAAKVVEGVEAVVTIGAPSDPGHVVENFRASLDVIQREGQADVQLAGRTFTIKKQFLDDLEAREGDGIGNLGAALLVMHSPTDETVPVSEARRIYDSARGYKSFVTLADAGHLLGRRQDAEYAADVIAAWASRYVDAKEPADARDAERPERTGAIVREVARPYTNRVVFEEHELVADEPSTVGGADAGPSPFELLNAELGACTSMTLRMYADRKKWPVDDLQVRVTHERVKTDDDGGLREEFDREIRIDGDLTEEQRERLIEIANRCPVHRALENPKEIRTREV